MKLLLVEDEALLSKNIAKGLRLLGYAVDCAFDGEEALELYSLNDYDLMILDLNLPKLDGMEVLQRIREQDADFRILILSARDTLEDKISGLDGGSNDYLTKPFEFKELEARIRGLLRRSFTTADPQLRCGRLRVDTASRRVWCGQSPVELTRKEYALLEYLLTNARRVIGAGRADRARLGQRGRPLFQCLPLPHPLAAQKAGRGGGQRLYHHPAGPRLPHPKPGGGFILKTWTLQARLTAIVAAILLSACLLLTTNSLFAARAYYGDYAALLESGLVEVDPAWEEGAGPDDALASPIEFYREASQKFSAQSLLAMALIALLAVGSTYLATGQVLRPLKNLTASAGVIDGRHLDRRVQKRAPRGRCWPSPDPSTGCWGGWRSPSSSRSDLPPARPMS